MPKWLRKSLMVMVTIVTFGLITPQSFVAEDHHSDQDAGRDILENKTPSYQEEFVLEDEATVDQEQFISIMMQEAERQSYEKFGERIRPVIEDEFKEIILPNMEKVIKEVAASYAEEDLTQLTITHMPSGGVSEKIFHIKNSQTNADIIRFHVRRDNPPQSGYSFNFHYHLANDSFQTHYELGDIYWSKNTPPKWMS